MLRGLWSSTKAQDACPALAPQQDSQTQQEPEQAWFPGSTTRLLDGRAAAAEWEQELREQVDEIKRVGGRAPGLAVVLVGDRADSRLYVHRKREACARVGITERLVHLPADVDQERVKEVVQQLCAEPTVDGVMVQLPLPAPISEEEVMEVFDHTKDIDGFHPMNMGRMLMRGRRATFIPATALGTMRLLRWARVPLRHASAVVVGDSNIVGTPLAALLRDEGAASVTVVHRASYEALFADAASPKLAAARAAARAWEGPRVPHGPSQAARAADPYGLPLPPDDDVYRAQGAVGVGMDGVEDGESDATPTSLHSLSQNTPTSHVDSDRHQYDEAFSVVREQVEGLGSVTQAADLLVVAVGFPRLVGRAWVKPGATVVDAGINVQAGHVVGDVDAEEVQGVAGAMTPVPGGIGPMTVAATMANVVLSARRRLLGTSHPGAN